MSCTLKLGPAKPVPTTNVVSSVPLEFILAIAFLETPLTVVNCPPIIVFPSVCGVIHDTWTFTVAADNNKFPLFEIVKKLEIGVPLYCDALNAPTYTVFPLLRTLETEVAVNPVPARQIAVVLGVTVCVCVAVIVGHGVEEVVLLGVLLGVLEGVCETCRYIFSFLTIRGYTLADFI